jgi:hypothetical protein
LIDDDEIQLKSVEGTKRCKELRADLCEIAGAAKHPYVDIIELASCEVNLSEGDEGGPFGVERRVESAANDTRSMW